MASIYYRLSLCLGLLMLCVSSAAGASVQTMATSTTRAAEMSAAAGCTDPFTLVSQRTISDDFNIIEGLDAVSPTDIWAVGRRSGESYDIREQPLIQRWNGTVWNTIASPDLGQNARLAAVDVVSANDVWAVGSVMNQLDWKTLILHWDGVRWEHVPSPHGMLYDVNAINAHDVWAVGDDGSTPLVLHWNGSVWERVTLPASGTSIWLRSVVALSNNDVWVAGSSPIHIGKTVIMHYDGATWTPIADAGANVDGMLEDLSASSKDSIWAVGSVSYQPLMLRWNGSEWQKASLPTLSTSTNELADVIALSSNDVWAVGSSSNQALVLHWDGAVWQDVSPPRAEHGDEYYNAVTAVGNDVWAAGSVSGRTTLIRRYQSRLTFGDVNVSHGDAGGTANITIRLSTPAMGPTIVNYATRDRTALAGVDYRATSGTITIPTCGRDSIISVPLLPSSGWKPGATFELMLSQPAGAGIEGSATLAVNIANYNKAGVGQVLFLPLVRHGIPTTGGRLAYVGVQNNNWDIYVMNAEGTNRRRLTTGPSMESSPAWSPDGRRIAFMSDQDGNSELYLMAADGTGIRRLTNHPAHDTMPSWSPDNRHIVFVSKRAGQQLLHVIDVDTGNVRQLTNSQPGGNPQDEFPAWSPNGQQIAFASTRGGGSGIWVVGSDGSNMRRLTAGYYDTRPAWSPNSEQIVYGAGLPHIARLRIMRGDGSGNQELNANFDTGISPAYSPDGRKVATGTFYGSGISIVDTENATLPATLPLELSAEFSPAWTR